MVEYMTWEDSVTKFQAEFSPLIDVQQLARESQDIFQTTEMMADITAMFRERSLLVPKYVADEEMKKVVSCYTEERH